MQESPPERLTVEKRLTPAQRIRIFRSDVLAGLSGSSRTLVPKWSYDEAGGRLFEAITNLPEYYLTGREYDIIATRAVYLAEVSHAELVMELGSGSSRKTRTILTALQERGYLRQFVPLDVDEAMLRREGRLLVEQYPGMVVHAIVGDYEYNVSPIPHSSGPRLILFLGSTIGNLRPPSRLQLLYSLQWAMSSGDMLLLGIDLVKQPSRIIAAYNDPGGVSAAFAKNALDVINRVLNGSFKTGQFRHLVEWNANEEQLETYLEATAAQRVFIKDIDLHVDLSLGDRIQTEISAKFRRERIELELRGAGLRTVEWWTDVDADFGVALAVKE